MAKIKKSWYKITKYFKGGSNEYQIKTQYPMNKFETEYLLEKIGENTSGGHAGGYRIYIRKLPKKSKKLKVLGQFVTTQLY